VLTNKKSRVQPRSKAVAAETCNPQKLRKTIHGSSKARPERRPIAGSNTSQSAQRELWIAETTSLSRQKDALPWSTHPASPSDARLLELADIALGLRKPQPFRRRRSLFLAAQLH